MVEIERFIFEAYTPIHVSIANLCAFAVCCGLGFWIGNQYVVGASLGFLIAGLSLGSFGMLNTWLGNNTVSFRTEKPMPRNPYTPPQKAVRNPYARYEPRKEVKQNGVPQSNDNFSSEIES